MLSAVSVTATSDAFDTSMRRKLSVEASLATPVIGSGTVGFLVSNNGVNFVTYNRITTDVTDSNTQTDARVATVTIDSTTPRVIALFPEGDYFRYLKATFTAVTGAILTSSIGAPGSAYAPNDVLTVADGTGGTITVLTVDGSGVVLTYSLTTGGTGYSIATHATTGGTGGGFTLAVATVNPGLATCVLQNID